MSRLILLFLMAPCFSMAQADTLAAPFEDRAASLPAPTAAKACACDPLCPCGCAEGKPCQCSLPDKDGWRRYTTETGEVRWWRAGTLPRPGADVSFPQPLGVSPIPLTSPVFQPITPRVIFAPTFAPSFGGGMRCVGGT